MILRGVLNRVVTLLNGNPTKGVPEVMLYVAALDGKILPEEISAYRTLAAKCPGCSATDVEKGFLEALRGAGYLLALAAAEVDEDVRIRTFVAESLKVIPRDFTQDLENVRYAVLLWTAVAIADEDYAGVEMRALKALKEQLAQSFLRATEAVATLNAFSPNGELANVQATAALADMAHDRVSSFLKSDCLAEAAALLNA